MKRFNLVMGIIVTFFGVLFIGLTIFLFVNEVEYYGFNFLEYSALLSSILVSVILLFYGIYLICFRGKRQ